MTKSLAKSGKTYKPMAIVSGKYAEGTDYETSSAEVHAHLNLNGVSKPITTHSGSHLKEGSTYWKHFPKPNIGGDLKDLLDDKVKGWERTTAFDLSKL